MALGFMPAPCPRHATWPKNRAAFWLAKITDNKTRDRRVNRALRARGWTVARVWEHELRRKDEARLVRRLRLQMTDEFKCRVESSERRMAQGQRPRARSVPE